MQATYYKPSGKISPLFVLLFIVFMAISIPILSVAYIYAIFYIPFIYLNIIIAIACGLGLGFAVLLATQLGKARNRVLVIVLTILAVFLLKYTQWCVYIPLVYAELYMELQADFAERLLISLELFFDPAYVLIGALDINEWGAWGFGESGDAVTGGLLLGVWILEFLVIMISAVAVCWWKTVFPFSENANAWYTESKPEINACMSENFDALRASLETGNFNELVHLAHLPRVDGSNYLGITVFEPPASSSMEPYYLSITGITATYDKKGTETLKRNPLITHIAVDPGTVAALKQPPVQQPLEVAPPAYQ
ncbi:MAG: hypothetical protein FWE41_08875 [Coriobacteriia bacterium]|nr:hypothetical protein [Coriobacteriia bacterium]MCL2749959.1 hypothetical protein [Coriobacteriia bacterium]